MKKLKTKSLFEIKDAVIFVILFFAQPICSFFILLKTKKFMTSFLLLGLIFSLQIGERVSEKQYNVGSKLITRVYSELNQTDYSTSFIGTIGRSKYLISIDSLPALKYGDYLEVEVTSFEKISNQFNNQGSFSTVNYYLSFGVFHKIKAEVVNHITSQRNLFDYFKNIHLQLITSEDNPVINAFVYGHKNFSDLINREINETGVAHIFSLSGFHVGLLYSLVFFILALFKIPKDKSRSLVTLLSSFYVFIGGYNVPLFRAIIFTNLKLYFKNINSQNLLAWIATAFILLNPFIVYSLGFSLSFLIVFYLLQAKEKNFFNNSLIIFLISTVILLNKNFTINFLTPVINLFITPLLLGLVFPLCLLSALFNLSFIGDLALGLFNFISMIISFFNQATIAIGQVKLPFLILISFFVLQLINHFNFKKVLLIFFIFFINSFHIQNSRISFLDVGQGDAILLSTNYGLNNILIDTGDESASSEIVTALRAKKVTSLDSLIITHFDQDHAANLNLVASLFHPKKIISSDSSLQDENILLINKQEKFKFGNLILRFIPPLKKYEEKNNNSLVIEIQSPMLKILLTGDIELEREEELITNHLISEVDILKVAHHGSKTSSCEKFLDLTSPRLSIISVGKNNRYNHPAPEVTARLSQRHIKIHQTAIDGEFTISLG